MMRVFKINILKLHICRTMQHGILQHVTIRKFKNLNKNIHNPSNGFYVSIIPNLWLITAFIIPISLVFKISFTEPVMSIPPLGELCSWTGNQILNIKLNIANYIRMVKEHYYISAFVNSVCITTLTTLLCLIFGFPMAYAICKTKPRTQAVLISLLSLSIWTATLIRIYALINLLGSKGVLNSLLTHMGMQPVKFLGSYTTVCLGLVFCYLPYMIFPIYSILEKYDKSCVEAAYDLGCSPLKTLWKVTIPLCRGGIITGCILVFATTVGEFSIPELLGSSDTLMFGRILWTEFFNNLDWPMTCAISIVMMAFIILPMYFIQKKYGETIN